MIGNRRKKFLTIILLAGTWLVLSAFKLTAVELKNADKPFIDLGSEVVDSEIGHGGNTETGLEGFGEDTQTEKTQIDIHVEITEKRISVDGTTCINTQDMVRLVKANYRSGMKLHLVDNYAEYHTYVAAKEALKETKISFFEEMKN